jgi:hypothetical protein
MFATQAVDVRVLDRHPVAAVTSLIPALSCRSGRPNPPFAELVLLRRKDLAAAYARSFHGHRGNLS